MGQGSPVWPTPILASGAVRRKPWGPVRPHSWGQKEVSTWARPFGVVPYAALRPDETKDSGMKHCVPALNSGQFINGSILASVESSAQVGGCAPAPDLSGRREEDEMPLRSLWVPGAGRGAHRHRGVSTRPT